jgi:PAS domain S-box-containing protein
MINHYKNDDGLQSQTENNTIVTKSQQILHLWAQIVESAPNSIIIVNSRGNIVLVNNQTEKLFGYTSDELSGNQVDILVPDYIKNKHAGFLSAYFSNPQTRPMGAGRDLHGIRKDGSEMPIEIALNPIEEGLVLCSVVDITERKRAEEKFRIAFEAAPNAMIMVNQEGKIILINAQTEKVFGYTREELMDNSIEILVPERFREKHPFYRQSFYSHSEVRSMGAGRDLYGLRKNGTEMPVEIGLNPIKTEEGLFVLAAIVDITERKHTEEKLSQRKNELEKANLELDSFVYTASHDLRAPLRGIAGFSLLLEKDYKEKLDDRGQDFLNEIRKGVNRMTKLIEDLLALSRITRIQNPYKIVDISKSVSEAIGRLEYDIKKMHVELIIQEHLPFVYCDQIKITEVFVNLINNAIKFSSKNTVNPKIEISFLEKKESWEFYVSDNGIGIDPKFHEQIFGLFKRLHAEKEYEGTGAGLNIVQRIIEEHGGIIKVKSEPNKGSTFLFSIPKNLKNKPVNINLEAGK